MITLEALQHYMMGPDIADALILKLETLFEDFQDVKKRYDMVMDTLQEERGDTLVPCVKDVKNAIVTQITSTFHFSSYLGLKANLEHFTNPMARTFMDVEPELYLQEKAANLLPEYKRAQETLDRFCSQLSPNQKELYESVFSYIGYLETAVPKLAHYYGYLFGNMYLYNVIPGYHSDPVLDVQYCLMLANYFGIDPAGLML